jgi:hypothetical protein
MLAFVLAQVLLLVQDAPPRSYRPEFENARVRVTRVVYQPREKIALHDHPANPTVYVYLRDSGPVRFVHIGDEPFTLTRPAVRAGGFRLSKGAKETHRVESLTDQLTEYLRIEFKGLAVDRQVFRGRFPPETGAARRRAGLRVRYEDGQVRITRVTCAARRACDGLGASEAASLLVALTTAQLKSDAAGAELTLALGQTMWSEAGAAPPFTNASDKPTEFLRIDLK